MNKPLILIGAGDHARVLLDILLAQGKNVIGIADKAMPAQTLVYGVPVLGDDDFILRNYSSDSVDLVNGIGSVGSLALRSKVFDFFKNKGYHFASVVHPSAVVSERATLGEGVQILAGAVVNTEAKIGSNTIINTNASVDHGCVIGNSCHIAPGCSLSGCVTVGDNTHIGTGSTVIQGVSIGRNVLLGAGSVVVSDIADNSKAYGVPAKMINTIYMTGGVEK